MAENIFEKAVLLSVEKNSYGLERKAKNAIAVAEYNTNPALEEEETDGAEETAEAKRASKRRYRITKKILAGPELKAIAKCDARINKMIETRSVPSKFKAGMYLLPHSQIEAAYADLESMALERQALVDQAKEALPRLIQEALSSTELAELGDPRDYPTPEEFAAAYSMSWCLLEFNTPDSLKEIKADIFKKEQEKAATHWKGAGEQITEGLRAAALKLVDHMVEILQPGENGKPKGFRNSSVKNLQEFISTIFDRTEVIGDKELPLIMKQAADLIGGLDAKMIKSNESLRSSLEQGFSKISQDLTQLVTDKKRQFNVKPAAAPESISLSEVADENPDSPLAGFINEVAAQAEASVGQEPDMTAFGEAAGKFLSTVVTVEAA